MSLFDSRMGKAGSIDLGALAQDVGLTPAEVKAGGESLLAKLASGDHDATSATVATSAETGIDAGKLTALLPALAGALGGTDGEGGTLSGIATKLTGFLETKADGEPMGSLGDLAKGLFGKG
jgi:hypothetical protein